MRLRRLLPVLLLVAGCAGPSQLDVTEAPPPGEPVVTLTILQLNDVYEITPVAGGTAGGLARVATIRQRLLREDANVLTVMAGDFYSPSALGTARVDGERLNGKQMVAVLNVLGLDVATFGNHEFDLDEEAFLQRLDESAFAYVSANVTDDDGALFPKTEEHLLLTIEDESGATMRLGIVGTTLPSTPTDYVDYEDPLPALQAEVAAVADSADVVLALTHLALEDDVRVAAGMPEVDLVLGGHEHENVRLYRGPDLTPVLKADANARTVYVHRLRFDTLTGELRIASELVPVTDAIPEDPAVAAEVSEWVEAAYAGFEAGGFVPDARVATTTEGLDGREATIRNQPTNLGALIAQAFLAEADAADLAIFNSGSVRVDDVLPAGPITQYDVIRVLPFGGEVLTVSVPGDLLRRVLEQGLANRGSGGFLQTANVAQADDGTWQIGGAPLDDERVYRVAVSDFLVSGRETGLDYFDVEANPSLEVVARHRDVRMALIDELQRRFGS
ncbi:MAG: bifunctional metallophosphatase/5'-nucleotidase [Rubricoccaceae bacterium]|nr:bifunctional metallophosphatase/5'-nucleotidase [Rubricoccaceae bacterium]